MDPNGENERFEIWAVVELFGHQQIAGLVTEQKIGGQSFIRVDVPEIEDRSGFTKFYGPGAIYAITPTTEELARTAVDRLRVRPIEPWMIEEVQERPQLGIEGELEYEIPGEF
jgi:hypothetical protein